MEFFARGDDPFASARAEEAPAGENRAMPPRPGTLSDGLRRRLARDGNRRALEHLAQEISLETLDRALARVRDEEVAQYLVDALLMMAAVLSSEAFGGIDLTRRRLRALEDAPRRDAATARRSYDRLAETLARYVFALGRRLHQLESFFAGCPLSGSAEELRGLVGQRARDLAGDVRFVRLELDRWLRRFVPLGRDLPSGTDLWVFLEGRIAAVVDDLGLRLREIRESLSAAALELVRVLDPAVGRSDLFKAAIENRLDVDRLLGWIDELIERLRAFDEGRRAEQLESVRGLLGEFPLEALPAPGGLRESDAAALRGFVRQLLDEAPQSPPAADDPVHPFLLLLGEVRSRLAQERLAAD